MINADDAGIDSHVDNSILRAAQEGLLTSATVLANGKTARSFVAEANRVGLALGLHFNITEGRPVAPNVTRLVGDDGLFCETKNDVWRHACSGFLDPIELKKEAEAQWRALTAMGADITHLDSHNHVHLYPCVLEALLDSLPKDRPLHIRIPYEKDCPKSLQPPFPNPFLGPKEMRAMIKKSGHYSTDYFVGFRFSNDPKLASIDALQTFEPSSCEWMVHPGKRAGTSFRMSQNRTSEFDFLTADLLRESLSRWGFRVVQFGALQ